MMTSATYRGPWVFVCAGCDLLAISSRRHTTTCSGACRVKANRNGSLKALRDEARQGGMVDRDTGRPMVAEILQGAAVDALCPDLARQALAGTATMGECQRAAYSEMQKILREIHAEQGASSHGEVRRGPSAN